MAAELYNVLNVKADASTKDIRNAYRRLAKKYHPDLNPGDKAAENTFRSVQRAHDILSDETKRRQYDAGEIDAEGKETPRHYYHEYAGQNEPYASAAGHDDINNIFSEIFGARAGQDGATHMRMRGGDTQYQLDIAFTDSIIGAKKRIQMPDGKTLDVTVPPGHRDGQVLRLKAKGMPGIGGGPNGDAYIKVHVKPDPVFERRDADIHMTLPISINEAILGAKVAVPTVHGQVTMNIPAHANSGDVLRLKGKGVPGKTKDTNGNQLIKLQVILPKTVDQELETFIKDWAVDNAYDPRQKMSGAGHDQ